MPRKIDISHRTIIFIAIFILGLWVIYHVLDLIILLFVALIFMSALAPAVSFFQNFKIPKPLSILIVYIILIAILSTLLTISFAPLVEQTSKLIFTLPAVLSESFRVSNIDPQVIREQLPNISGNIFSITRAIFDNFITIIFLLVITFYLLLERSSLEEKTAGLIVGREEQVKQLLVQLEEKLGAWMRGQISLSLIIGVVTYIGLFILQIPYALPLAILAGFMEVVPVIGPIISAIPAVILAYAINPVLAGGVAALYFVIQQLENHLIVPQVMKRAVGLNPLVVILAIALGGRLLGIPGALLAVPIVVAGQVIMMEFLKEYRKQ
jgi:predicted PurR-regulated permease PerM